MLQGYKADNGVIRTLSLFCEFNRTTQTSVFTLKEYDHELNGVTYPSLRQVYLKCRDPSERRFALKAFGSWDQWVKLQEADWFKPYLKVWRDELEALMRAEAMDMAYKIMEDPDASSATKLQASKLVFSQGRGEGQKRRGRPSNKKDMDTSFIIASEEEEDAQRIGLAN